jgi:hypothetical protein
VEFRCKAPEGQCGRRPGGRFTWQTPLRLLCLSGSPGWLVMRASARPVEERVQPPAGRADRCMLQKSAGSLGRAESMCRFSSVLWSRQLDPWDRNKIVFQAARRQTKRTNRWSPAASGKTRSECKRGAVGHFWAPARASGSGREGRQLVVANQGQVAGIRAVLLHLAATTSNGTLVSNVRHRPPFLPATQKYGTILRNYLDATQPISVSTPF